MKQDDVELLARHIAKTYARLFPEYARSWAWLSSHDRNAYRAVAAELIRKPPACLRRALAKAKEPVK